MAIISRTVAAHKEEIEVGDGEGGGAKFTMRLPPFARPKAAVRGGGIPSA